VLVLSKSIDKMGVAGRFEGAGVWVKIGSSGVLGI
jgi:hypothetical protein